MFGTEGTAAATTAAAVAGFGVGTAVGTAGLNALRTWFKLICAAAAAAAVATGVGLDAAATRGGIAIELPTTLVALAACRFEVVFMFIMMVESCANEAIRDGKREREESVHESVREYSGSPVACTSTAHLAVNTHAHTHVQMAQQLTCVLSSFAAFGGFNRAVQSSQTKANCSVCESVKSEDEKRYFRATFVQSNLCYVMLACLRPA